MLQNSLNIFSKRRFFICLFAICLNLFNLASSTKFHSLIHTRLFSLFEPTLSESISPYPNLKVKSQLPKMSSFDSNGSEHILVTGGTGYIGAHTVVTLLDAGYSVTIVDNLVNSSPLCLKRILQITQCDPERLRFFEVDCKDKEALEEVFRNSPRFKSCIHFAGLKAVGESCRLPLKYYDNNIGSTLTLLNLLDKYQCHSIIFSSSATVYGEAPVPIIESFQTGIGIVNPYGRTKYMIEEILKDFKLSKDLEGNSGDNPWSICILRYFNPVGAHPSGLIGEDPNGIPNNLMPFVAQVAVGRREKITIFGNDYNTKDGTGVRDYIHIMDLAEGHLAALRYLEGKSGEASAETKPQSTKELEGKGKLSIFNLGTGKGISVLEMVLAMEEACGKTLNYEFGPRRPGDISVCYADPERARKELGWEAKRDLKTMCKDLWNWQSNNPNGYC